MKKDTRIAKYVFAKSFIASASVDPTNRVSISCFSAASANKLAKKACLSDNTARLPSGAAWLREYVVPQKPVEEQESQMGLDQPDDTPIRSPSPVLTEDSTTLF